MNNLIALKSSLQIYAPNFLNPLSRPLYSGRVPAGFPSPADDHIERELDLHELLIDHPAATFYVRMSGESLKNIGLINGDILIVDRSLEAKHNNIVVAAVNGEFTAKRFYCLNGVIELHPENELFNPIVINPDQDFCVWGVVIGSVRRLKT